MLQFLDYRFSPCVTVILQCICEFNYSNSLNYTWSGFIGCARRLIWSLEVFEDKIM